MSFVHTTERMIPWSIERLHPKQKPSCYNSEMLVQPSSFRTCSFTGVTVPIGHCSVFGTITILHFA